MTKAINKLAILGLIWGLTSPLFAQEDVLKKYAEERSERTFCFYPSTLRMINLSKNPEFNEMVKPIEKMMIFMLDSTAQASKDYRKLPAQFQKNGFEEYVTMIGGGNNLFIYGSESDGELLGVMAMQESLVAFYLRGNVNWQKIPKLMTTMKENELLQIFDVKR